MNDHQRNAISAVRNVIAKMVWARLGKTTTKPTTNELIASLEWLEDAFPYLKTQSFLIERGIEQ